MANRLEMLRTFAAVAQMGNLAEAADRLGRTQAAVSMSLKNLERDLGVSLFSGERKNTLSPVGAQIYTMAKQQIRHFDAGMRQIEAAARSPTGMLRIAAVPSIGNQVFADIAKAIQHEFPEMHLDLRDEDSARIYDDLIDGRIDMGIASNLPPIQGVSSQTLLTDRFGLICHKDHPLAIQPEAPRLEAVFAADFVSNDFMSLLGLQAPAANAAGLMAHNSLTLISLIENGGYISLLPESVAKIRAEQLIFRPLADLSAIRTVSVYARQSEVLTDAIGRVTAILLNRLNASI